MALKSLLKKIQCMVLKMIEVIMKSKMTLLTYGGGKKLSAVVIFNQKLKIRFRSGMAFLLWWREFDGLGRILLSQVMT